MRKKHISLCLWIKTGSVRELATNNGVAHLLEHSLFGQYSKKNQKSRVYEEIKNNDLKINKASEEVLKTDNADSAKKLENKDQDIDSSEKENKEEEKNINT